MAGIAGTASAELLERATMSRTLRNLPHSRQVAVGLVLGLLITQFVIPPSTMAAAPAGGHAPASGWAVVAQVPVRASVRVTQKDGTVQGGVLMQVNEEGLTVERPADVTPLMIQREDVRTVAVPRRWTWPVATGLVGIMLLRSALDHWGPGWTVLMLPVFAGMGGLIGRSIESWRVVYRAA